MSLEYETDNAADSGMDTFEAEAAEHQDSENKLRYVAFVSDNLVYAINARYVTEIITNHAITMLPMVPNYISGIINLRGQIIPIIDIRLRMGKFPLEREGNCIIVLNVDSVDVGIQVDAVSQVLDIDEAKISPMPSNNHQELVGGIMNMPGGDTILFFDCNLLVSGY